MYTTYTMSNIDEYDLQELEKIVEQAKEHMRLRELERKAIIADMMRPMTEEERINAEAIVKRAKEAEAWRRSQKKKNKKN